MNDSYSPMRRGRPFGKGESGNPRGRPPGARNRTTLAAEALLEGEAEALTHKLVELALSGDIAALRICVDRILPRPRERRVNFDMPPLLTRADGKKAMHAITCALAAGDITINEALQLSQVVEIKMNFIREYIALSDQDLALLALQNYEERKKLLNNSNDQETSPGTMRRRREPAP
jgi:hypothetical protein